VQVGDLVELSASGRNTVYCRHLRDRTGIVVEMRQKGKYMYPIVVSWFGFGQIALLRSALKFVSRV
jgi:predicted  nucleic acid-binding Zn-ribbon protein